LPDAPDTATVVDGTHGPTTIDPTRSHVPLKRPVFGKGANGGLPGSYNWPALAGGVVVEL
jgi:hypothetical protein